MSHSFLYTNGLLLNLCVLTNRTPLYICTFNKYIMRHNTKSIFILEKTFIIFNTYLTMAFIGLSFDQIFLDSFKNDQL